MSPSASHPYLHNTNNNAKRSLSLCHTKLCPLKQKRVTVSMVWRTAAPPPSILLVLMLIMTLLLLLPLDGVAAAKKHKKHKETRYHHQHHHHSKKKGGKHQVVPVSHNHDDDDQTKLDDAAAASQQHRVIQERRYHVTIDTRTDPNPQQTLDRVTALLGGHGHFDRGRLRPNLEGILDSKALSTLYRAGIRFHAVRDKHHPAPPDHPKHPKHGGNHNNIHNHGASGSDDDDPDFPPGVIDLDAWKHSWNASASYQHQPSSAAEEVENRIGIHPLPIDKRRYHSNQEVEHILRALAARCRRIMSLHNVGHTTRGDIIWAMRVTDNIAANEVGEAELLMVGGIHGDEPVGRELLLWTLEHICDIYKHHEPMKNLIDSLDLWVVPSLNPDGYAAMSRYNAHHVDLNRNFPDRLEGQPVLLQAETESIMNFMQSHTFVASLSFHGGSMVVSYPWDGNEQHRSGLYTAAPDDATFRALAWSYASHNPIMTNNREFPNGITNGAHWYVLYGGMQDWAYGIRGNLQVTVELSTPKWPHANSLPLYWTANRISVFSWMYYTRRGIWGVVKDGQGHPVRGAYLVAFDRRETHPKRMGTIWVDPEHADYYRILLPGAYSLEVLAAGYEPLMVPTFRVEDGPPLRRDFVLRLAHHRAAGAGGDDDIRHEKHIAPPQRKHIPQGRHRDAKGPRRR